MASNVKREQIAEGRAEGARKRIADGEVAFIVYLGATNDANGNPRRGWCLHGKDQGNLIAFVHEGYGGEAAMRKLLPGLYDWSSGYTLPITGRYEITPGQYRALVRGEHHAVFHS